VEAKTRFLEALRAGATTKEAARPSGFSAEAFYCVRKRDPLFRLGWLWAVDLSTEDERQRRRNSSLVALVDGVEIAPNNRRVLQKRPVRATRFTTARQQVFLDVFAATSDFKAAVEAAGVSASTVYKKLAREPDFAMRRDAARGLGVKRLEDEAVRQRLAAQERLRDPAVPESELAIENERLMALLAYYQRKEAAGGSPGAGHKAGGGGGQIRGDFWEGIAWCDARLRAMGVRWDVIAAPVTPPPPPPGDAADGAQ
jgi:hypothetical protein